jgi:hypothetical protein
MLEYLRFLDTRATRQKPFTHRDVGRLVSYYYKEPAEALAEARAEMQKAASPKTAPAA